MCGMWCSKVIMRSVYLFAVALLFVSCALRSISSYPAQNSIEYIFNVNVDSARFVFVKSYWKYHNELKFDLQELNYHGDGNERLWTESAKAVMFGEANKHDMWMVISVDSSVMYRDKKGNALPYLMECKAHFEHVGYNQTKMGIQVLSAKVIVGKKWLPSIPHFVNSNILKEVKSSTAEEYKLLLCLGKGLGASAQMLPLKTN